MPSYGSFGLSANPFAEERFDLPMVGREEDWARLKEVMVEQLKTRSARLSVVFGDYGMGKSFTLAKVQEFLMSGDPLLPRPAELFAVRFRTTEPMLPKNYAVDLFTRMMKQIGRERLTEVCSVALSVSAHFESTFANVVAGLAGGESIAWDWLIGRKLTSSQLQTHNLSYKVTDYSEIHSLFMNALQLFKSGGVDSLVMLMDELEFLLSLASRTKLLTILHEIQSLWDDYNQLPEAEKEKRCKTVFVFASSIGSWDKFLELAQDEKRKRGGGGTQTFLRRIPPNATVSLSPLGRKEIRELLIQRMDQYSTTRTKNTLSPFAEDYIELINRLSFGIPSKVLALSALVVEQAKIAPISAATAENILKEFGTLEEMSEVES